MPCSVCATDGDDQHYLRIIFKKVDDVMLLCLKVVCLLVMAMSFSVQLAGLYSAGMEY